MKKTNSNRWRPVSNTKPSLLKYIKVFFSLISLAQSTVIKNDCQDDCDYSFTRDMFSDGTYNYLTLITDDFESCYDSAKKLYDLNTDTITQIQQGQLCQGKPATPPIPTQWQLIWGINPSSCDDSNCYALSFYSPINITVNTIFVECAEGAFSKNQDQYQEYDAQCQPKTPDYRWLILPGAFLLCFFSYCCTKYNTLNERDEEEDDFVVGCHRHHSQSEFFQNGINGNGQRLIAYHHDPEQSLQAIPPYIEDPEDGNVEDNKESSKLTAS